ncbi:MAG: DUF308 domain-containing protein [Alphaproteobacteria bacterium]|nr:DUF308 domain-containing protein [Alphaproteobacteria bacterium]
MIIKICGIWHLIAGLIMMLTGVLIWLNPMASLLALAFYLGLIIFLLGSGYIAFSLYQASGWYMVIGLLDLFLGLIFMTNLGVTVHTFPIFFVLWFLASGTLQIAGAYDLYKLGQPYGWSLCSGILGILLSFMILKYQMLTDFALVAIIGFYVFAYGFISAAEYFYFRQFCEANKT